jgi:hypothetical protein
MARQSLKFLVLAPLAAGALPVTAAQAQYYGSNAQPAPLYPYAVQNSNGVRTSQPYAVEVAPNVYEIKRPAASRNYPYVRGGGQSAKPVPNATKETKAPRFDRPPKPVDHALIEELRKRTVKRTVINTTRIVRDPPVVIETKRYVDDPPRVIERHHVVEDEPVGPRRKPSVVAEREPEKPATAKDDKVRIIRAEAEVTILGPDRMSIRLFRKGQAGSKAKAQAE